MAFRIIILVIHAVTTECIRPLEPGILPGMTDGVSERLLNGIWLLDEEDGGATFERRFYLYPTFDEAE